MRLAPSGAEFQIALVQFSTRLHRSLKLLRRVTGLQAVTSVAPIVTDASLPLDLSPPLHPRCARRLRSVTDSPCAEQWRIHGRSMRRSSRTNSHTCPIGLRCSCVPIHFGDRLVGVAKLVADAAVADSEFKTAMNLLKTIISQVSQELTVTGLSEEVRSLQNRVAELQRMHSGEPSRADRSEPSGTLRTALVDRALAHLQLHYADKDLSLQDVARALGCNPKYLTTRFTKIAGEHMHSYLIKLRVFHACRLLIVTDDSVKSIALTTGFAGPGRLANAFRTRVGVSPREYRRIFSSP